MRKKAREKWGREEGERDGDGKGERKIEREGGSQIRNNFSSIGIPLFNWRKASEL